MHKVFSCKHEDLILDFWHPHKKLDSAVAQMCHPCMGEVETGTFTGFPGQPAQAHQQTPGPSVTSRLKTSGGQSLRNNVQCCPLASPTTLPRPPTHPHMDSNTKKSLHLDITSRPKKGFHLSPDAGTMTLLGIGTESWVTLRQLCHRVPSQVG